jgi:hypothetical protein
MLSRIQHVIFSLISPTWIIAFKAKKNKNPEEITKGIIRRNYGYLLVSVFSILYINHILNYSAYENTASVLLAILYVYMFPLSRNNEIFIAFITDALDKTDNITQKSTLTYSNRIILSLRSYIELIINYGCIYLLMPPKWYKTESVDNAIDAIYFSGVTITTLGYGDISPTNWEPKILVIHEVLCGFTLLIVSFAIYVGKNNEKTTRKG